MANTGIFEDNLTAKQNAFVKAYLSTGNGTEAARQTYNATSENSLAQIASENLRKPKIANVIRKRLKHIASPQEVLGEISEIALGNYDTYKSDKVKTLDMMAKHHRLFGEPININVNARDAATEALVQMGYDEDTARQLIAAKMAAEYGVEAVDGEVVEDEKGVDGEQNMIE